MTLSPLESIPDAFALTRAARLDASTERPSGTRIAWRPRHICSLRATWALEVVQTTAQLGRYLERSSADLPETVTACEDGTRGVWGGKWRSEKGRTRSCKKPVSKKQHTSGKASRHVQAELQRGQEGSPPLFLAAQLSCTTNLPQSRTRRSRRMHVQQQKRASRYQQAAPFHLRVPDHLRVLQKALQQMQ